MKKVMDWMKANLAIVVLSAVIVLSLPAALVGSQMWNSKIRNSRQAEVDKATKDLQGLKITYQMPGVTPGDPGKPLVLPAPNPVANEHFRKHREKLEKQITEVATVATAINSKDHAPMLDGLFPAPANNFKTLEMAELIVGRPGKPSVYEGLLKSINAGPPADLTRVAEVLGEIEVQYREKVRSDTSRDKLMPEEEAELTKKLVAARIGQYQQRAQEIAVYATMDVLPKEILRVAPPEPPDASTCFEWQYDYWVIQDLLRAIDAANGGPGSRANLANAAVKRIEKIALDPVGASEASITGRTNSPENKLYDVRGADLTLVVASARLPEVINAISRTNFMTVTGLNFRQLDPWADLDQGYYYGDENVVRADIRVETIWLRSWTEPLMPEAYKAALLGTTAEGEAAAAPPPAPVTGKGGASRGGAADDDMGVRRGRPGSNSGGGG